MKKYNTKKTDKSKNTETIDGRDFTMTVKYPLVVDEKTASELMNAVGAKGIPNISELDEIHLLLTIKREKQGGENEQN